MSNGIKDTVLLLDIAKAIDEVVKIRKKYGNCVDVFQADEYTRLIFDDTEKICRVKYSGRNYARYYYGPKGIIKRMKTGFTLGLAKSAIQLEKEAKGQYNRYSYKVVALAIKEALPDIERILAAKN